MFIDGICYFFWSRVIIINVVFNIKIFFWFIWVVISGENYIIKGLIFVDDIGSSRGRKNIILIY